MCSLLVLRFPCALATWSAILATVPAALGPSAPPAVGGELSVEDFTFRGPLGSEGATIEKLGPNHFKVTLGHAPSHADWRNMPQFRILRNAKGIWLRLDVRFPGGTRYRTTLQSWSYDGKNWQPVPREEQTTEGETLLFPEFSEDTVYFGHEFPMSYEELVEMIGRWQKHPHVTVHVLGKSLGGRAIYRLKITHPDSPHPRKIRWGHYFANQHPGEYNSRWRMVGMIDWLLSDEGADCRRRSICHFVPIMSPDGPSHGWFRVNAHGVDMNRSYFVGGSDHEKQAHEAYIVQKDLEALMASDAPAADIWSMHTWSGIVEPILRPGSEIGTTLGPWTELKEIMKRNDPKGLVKPLKAREGPGSEGEWTHWDVGPQKQLGVTAVLCEGAGGFWPKHNSLDAGAVLMKSIAEYYKGTKR